MRTPVILLLLALAGLLGGGALISMTMLGACLIFAAIIAGLFGVALHDFPDRPAQPRRRAVQGVEDYLKQKAAEHW